MSNEARGEISIKLGATPYTLKPTFKSLSEVEQLTGMGLIDLTQSFVDGHPKLSHMATVIMCCAHGEDGKKLDLSYDIVGEQLVKKGAMHFVPDLAKMLGGALTGGSEKKTADKGSD